MVTLVILRVVTELPHVELIELTLLKPLNRVAKKQQGEQKMGMICKNVHILQSLRDGPYSTLNSNPSVPSLQICRL